ncbi:Tm-1-like ATP-binding domain-containing protein, partial [Extibacter muris]|uniref:Tm-1-like ATP-binding domain-containing protein n=1 Tax=Extibacter muris TaxID=1796622 RepID=UPI002108D75D
VLSDSGYAWTAICCRPNGELRGLMTKAMCSEMLSLYNAGEIDAVLAAGRVQNTTVATRAMQTLPIGFPKVM